MILLADENVDFPIVAALRERNSEIGSEIGVGLNFDMAKTCAPFLTSTEILVLRADDPKASGKGIGGAGAVFAPISPVAMALWQLDG